jgi:hypothetical protein
MNGALIVLIASENSWFLDVNLYGSDELPE